MMFLVVLPQKSRHYQQFISNKNIQGEGNEPVAAVVNAYNRIKDYSKVYTSTLLNLGLFQFCFSLINQNFVPLYFFICIN